MNGAAVIAEILRREGTEFTADRFLIFPPPSAPFQQAPATSTFPEIFPSDLLCSLPAGATNIL
jgi:hypothetical protein